MAIALLTMLLALGAPADAGTAASPPSIFGRDSALGGVIGSAPDAGAPVAGSLDKEIIRRIIRRHINEVKYCYEKQLIKKPDLFGRIMVQFTIAASGQVVASVLQSSTMGDASVENCTVQAVRRWEFPKPLGGGIVIVSYPFVLTPERIPLVGGTKGGGAVDLIAIDYDLLVHRSTSAQGVPSNGLIAVTEQGLLLVDTAWTGDETEALLKWGEARLGRPWVGAIITHDHADRDGGLGALQQRHIPIAALDLTVAKLEKRGVHGVATLFTAKAGTIKDARGFEAFYPGPGHTTDNIVLKFPRALFGGCLIKSTDAQDLGFTGDADLASWPEAVRRVAARYAQVPIVPGHGPVDLAGASYQHTLDLLAAAAKKK
jgi:glyoxylase-like metal-dependent hydrolase (beta-lactamase superfamily II)